MNHCHSLPRQLQRPQRSQQLWCILLPIDNIENNCIIGNVRNKIPRNSDATVDNATAYAATVLFDDKSTMTATTDHSCNCYEYVCAIRSSHRRKSNNGYYSMAMRHRINVLILIKMILIKTMLKHLIIRVLLMIVILHKNWKRKLPEGQPQQPFVGVVSKIWLVSVRVQHNSCVVWAVVMLKMGTTKWHPPIVVVVVLWILLIIVETMIIFRVMEVSYSEILLRLLIHLLLLVLVLPKLPVRRQVVIIPQNHHPDYRHDHH